MNVPEPVRPPEVAPVPGPGAPTPLVPGPSVPRLDVVALTGRAGVRAAGEVSLPTRHIWEGVLERAVRHAGSVYHLELAALAFVDVAGADALADAARRFGARRLVLDRPPPALPRMLGLLWPGLPAIEVTAS
ncbi:STAS domain-containing protein [Streptomyces sp. IBSBF 3136]|uniref:STAS domain-containing protein n=1 Tax=Streptomyces sp. IBSBF 3136 TaxID=2903524 RepID=UPI002FDBE808